MKFIVIGLSVLLWCCSPIPRCPEGSRIILKGEFLTITTPDSLKWSVVPHSEFDNHCWNTKIGYVGSYNDYHLFQFWTKVLPAAGAEYQFATIKSDWTPKKEYQYRLKRMRSSADSVNTN